MKVETYAATVKVGETVWIAPKGKRTPVKVVVTEVVSYSHWVTIRGDRQTAKGLVVVEADLPGFAAIKMEM